MDKTTHTKCFAKFRRNFLSAFLRLCETYNVNGDNYIVIDISNINIVTN